MTIHVTRMEFEQSSARLIETARRQGEVLIVSENGEPSFEVKPLPRLPGSDPRSYETRRRDEEIMTRLRGTVLHYEGPFDPVGLEDWEGLK